MTSLLKPEEKFFFSCCASFQLEGVVMMSLRNTELKTVIDTTTVKQPLREKTI